MGAVQALMGGLRRMPGHHRLLDWTPRRPGLQSSRAGLLRSTMSQNRQPVMADCPEQVARLLRQWSRKAQSLRVPTDAEALRLAERRFDCRGIPRVDLRPGGAPVATAAPLRAERAAGAGTTLGGG